MITEEQRALRNLQAEITMKLGEIEDICRTSGYEVTPTLLLRHEDGADSSLLFGNDSLGKAVLCISELGEIGIESSMSPRDATLKLLTE